MEGKEREKTGREDKKIREGKGREDCGGGRGDKGAAGEMGKGRWWGVERGGKGERGREGLWHSPGRSLV